MHQPQLFVADGEVCFASRVNAPRAPRWRRFLAQAVRRLNFRRPRLTDPTGRRFLPPRRQQLPVSGKCCKLAVLLSSYCRAPHRLRDNESFYLSINLWWMHAPRVWCKVVRNAAAWPLEGTRRWRPCVPFEHNFCFSPKLTTWFVRRRLGRTPRSRPLTYLLDGI